MGRPTPAVRSFVRSLRACWGRSAARGKSQGGGQVGGCHSTGRPGAAAPANRGARWCLLLESRKDGQQRPCRLAGPGSREGPATVSGSVDSLVTGLSLDCGCSSKQQQQQQHLSRPRFQVPVHHDWSFALFIPCPPRGRIRPVIVGLVATRPGPSPSIPASCPHLFLFSPIAAHNHTTYYQIFACFFCIALPRPQSVFAQIASFHGPPPLSPCLSSPDANQRLPAHPPTDPSQAPDTPLTQPSRVACRLSVALTQRRRQPRHPIHRPDSSPSRPDHQPYHIRNTEYHHQHSHAPLAPSPPRLAL